MPTKLPAVLVIHENRGLNPHTEDVARRLRAVGLLRGDRGEAGDLRCFVTDNTPRFSALATRFLGMEVGEATWVNVDDLYRAGEVASRL